FVLALSTASYAQGIIGPKIGMSLSRAKDTKVPSGSTANTYTTLLTPQAGIMFNARLGDVISLRPEILYSQRGFKTSQGSTNYTARFSYVEIPFNVVGGIPAGPGKVEIFAGAAAGYLFGGKVTGGTTDYTIKGADQPQPQQANDKSAYYNYLNISLNFGLGYNYKGLVFQAGYNLGLSNINPHFENRDSQAEKDRSNDVTKLSGFTFGLAYLFGGKED
ncbi:MAG TPA: porin family protein, partial [Cytophagaceae bacterium]|nr:porin family protein [Cytophagaceae bacterium]